MKTLSKYTFSAYCVAVAGLLTLDLEAARKDGAQDPAALAPEGYLFAVSGTNVRECKGRTCPTLDPRLVVPNNCGGGSEPLESYIVHQRGVDWDGLPGEHELFGNIFQVTERFILSPASGELPGTFQVPYNQWVILQCCSQVGDSPPFLAMKAGPDYCEDPAGCPIFLGGFTMPGQPENTFLQLLKNGFKAMPLDRRVFPDFCDIKLVDAGWRDPHAPNDPGEVDSEPNDDSKRVFNLYYRAVGTCVSIDDNGVRIAGDGICDGRDELGEPGFKENFCAADCAASP